MRSALAILEGATLTCRAMVVRTGTRPITANTRQRTVLLYDITDEGVLPPDAGDNCQRQIRLMG